VSHLELGHMIMSRITTLSPVKPAGGSYGNWVCPRFFQRARAAEMIGRRSLRTHTQSRPGFKRVDWCTAATARRRHICEGDVVRLALDAVNAEPKLTVSAAGLTSWGSRRAFGARRPAGGASAPSSAARPRPRLACFSDPEIYHGHNVVERCFNQFQGLARPRWAETDVCQTSAGMSFRMAGYDPFWRVMTHRPNG
jgi:hypothetical protein